MATIIGQGLPPGPFVVGVHVRCTHHTRTVTLQTGVVDDAGRVVPAHLIEYRIGVRNMRCLDDAESAREEVEGRCDMRTSRR